MNDSAPTRPSPPLQPDEIAFCQAIACWTEGDVEQLDHWLRPGLPLVELLRTNQGSLHDECRQAFDALVALVDDMALVTQRAVKHFQNTPLPGDRQIYAQRLATRLRGIAYTLQTACCYWRLERKLDDAEVKAALQNSYVEALIAMSAVCPIDPRPPELLEPAQFARAHRLTRQLYEAYLQLDHERKRLINTSGWLACERLLAQLIPETLFSIDNEPGGVSLPKPTEVDLLLYAETIQLGRVMRWTLEIHRSTAPGLYVDINDAGLMVFEDDLTRSLTLALNINRLKLDHLCQERGGRPWAIVLRPQLPLGSMELPAIVTGESASLLLACGVRAALEGKSINEWMSASVWLVDQRRDKPHVNTNDLTWADDLQLHDVDPQGIPAKLTAAADQQLTHILLTRSQCDAFNEAPCARRLTLVPVDSWDDAYRRLTSDAELDSIIEANCREISDNWNQSTTSRDDAHRIDRYLAPSLSLLQKGRQPFDDGNYRERISTTESSHDDGYEKLTGDEVSQIRELLSAGPRLCIHDDAGSGKSVLAWRIEVVLSQTTPDSQRLRTSLFGSRQPLVVRWEGKWPLDGRSGDYWEKLREAMGRTIAERLYDTREEAERHIENICRVVNLAIQDGRLVLIVDAFDELSDESSNDFLVAMNDDRVKNHLANNHVILTSRPYEIKGRPDKFTAASWRYARIDGFDTELQQDQYLADLPRWRELVPNREEVAELLRLPIILRMIRNIVEGLKAEETIRPFSRRGDLYWESARRMVLRALERERPEREHIVRSLGNDFDETASYLIRVLSALAMHLTLNLDGDCREKDCPFAVRKNRIQKFLESARQHYLDDQPADHRSEELARWDAAITILRTIEFSNRSQTSVFNRSGVSFRSLKTMEFYSGFYLGNVANTSTREKIARFTNSPEWSWVWRFAIELPDDARVPSVLLESIALLLDRPREGERPSELIYLAWPLFESEPSNGFRHSSRVGRELPGSLQFTSRWRWQLWEEVARLTDVAQQREALRLIPSDVLLAIIDAANEQAAETVALLQLGIDADCCVQLRKILGPHRHWLTRISRNQLAATNWLGRAWKIVSRLVGFTSSRREMPAYAWCRPNSNQRASIVEFMMGAGTTRRRVRLTPFQMQTFSVTKWQLALFDSTKASHEAFDLPATSVDWFTAFAFSKWISPWTRLPTEAEREYACRAGSETEYWWGTEFDASRCNANNSNSRPLSREESDDRYVNNFGLCHMAGNIWEWCWDWYGDHDVAIEHDPVGPELGVYRVDRGGSWDHSAEYCWSAYRDWSRPGSRLSHLGFRLAWVPSSQQLLAAEPQVGRAQE